MLLCSIMPINISKICDVSFAGCVDEYFSDSNTEVTEVKSSEDPIYEGYKAVLDSKSIDEMLVSFSNSPDLVCSTRGLI